MQHTWMCILLAAEVSLAVIWRVPEDVPAIQVALDSLSNGDTVLVATGIYNESLQAPSDFFVLLGEVNPGGDPEKPIVDPSPLIGSTHMACLTLPFNSGAVIEDMIFRNGPQMFPRENNGGPGGIVNNGDTLVLRRCVFDSTYWGLSPNIGWLTVSECQFENSIGYGILDVPPRAVVIRDCSFSGTGRLLWVADSALIEYCLFDQPTNGSETIWLSGREITIRGCTFSPTTITGYAMIWTENSRGCVFENNVFRNIHVTGAAIMFNGIGGDTSRFTGNVFKQIYAHAEMTGGLRLQGPNILVNENSFDSCWAWSPNGSAAITLDGTDAIMQNNRFIGPNIMYPYVNAIVSPNARIHYCTFEHTGRALNSYSPMNAEFNWWGDSTGPFHAMLNPDGLGDEITGPVDFEPWLTENPLTTPDPRSPLPRSCQLDVFPNPFNATAILRLVVDQPGAYTVDLYNTVGQHVKELWSGQVTSEQHVTVITDALASGIYFACVRQSANTQPLALTKMLLLK